MKVIEVHPQPPSFAELLEAAQHEDILLVREGQPVARLEKFDAEDLEDWQYESSLAALQRGRHAREQYAHGEYKTLDQLKDQYGIKETN
jgi:hypothetical protein